MPGSTGDAADANRIRQLVREALEPEVAKVLQSVTQELQGFELRLQSSQGAEERLSRLINELHGERSRWEQERMSLEESLRDAAGHFRRAAYAPPASYPYPPPWYMPQSQSSDAEVVALKTQITEISRLIQQIKGGAPAGSVPQTAQIHGHAGIQFTDNHEVLEAASTQGLGARSIRSRQATNFVRPQEVQEASDDELVEVEIHQTADGRRVVVVPEGGRGAERNQRYRVPTAAVRKQDLPIDDDYEAGGVRFGNDNQIVEEVFVGPEGELRSVRTRQATRHVKPSDLGQGSNRGVQFTGGSDDVVEIGGQLISGRSVRGRQQTAFAKAPVEEEQHVGGLRFQDAEVLEAASEAAGGRSVRGRVQTQYAKPKLEGGSRGVVFRERVASEQEIDAVGVGDHVPNFRSARGRQPTAHVKVTHAQVVYDDEENVSGGKGVKFNAEAKQETQGRSARIRQATGYVRNAPPEEEDDGGGVRFGASNVHDEEIEVQGDLRSIRNRQATAYVKPQAMKGGGLQFCDSEEVLEAASGPAGAGRSVRSREATKFAAAVVVDDDNEPRKGARFVETADYGDAAAEFDENSIQRSVRGRVVTKYVTAVVVDDEDEVQPKKGIRMATQADFVEAHSESAGDAARSVRNRQQTKFAKPEAEPRPKKGVQMRERVSIQEIAGVGALQEDEEAPQLRSVRDRQATAHVSSSAVPADEEDDKKASVQGAPRDD